jgi:hypothetical protein
VAFQHFREPRHAEQFLDPRAQVDELELAVGALGGKVQSDNGAQRGAVDVVDVGEVEHEELGSWDQRSDGAL